MPIWLPRPPSLLQVTSRLEGLHFRPGRGWVPLGILSERVITNAGVAFLVDCLQGLATITDLNWHDSGTGTNAENVTDTALQAPAGPARVLGTKTEPASNQYRTSATIAYTSGATITEHGLFTASSGTVLFDRSTWAGTAVVNGDSIAFQYTLTIAPGG